MHVTLGWSFEEKYFIFWPMPFSTLRHFERKRVGGTDRWTDAWLFYIRIIIKLNFNICDNFNFVLTS
jgi:hypothetical protein